MPDISSVDLRQGYSVSGFLERLRGSRLELPLVDRADPLRRTRTQGIVSAAFQISRQLFLAEAEARSEPWAPALSQMKPTCGRFSGWVWNVS